MKAVIIFCAVAFVSGCASGSNVCGDSSYLNKRVSWGV